MRSASVWGSCRGLGGAGRLGAAPTGAYTAAVHGAALGHLASPPATHLFRDVSRWLNLSERTGVIGRKGLRPLTARVTVGRKKRRVEALNKYYI